MRVDRSESGWSTFFLGSDGKSRPADEIVVPAHITEDQVVTYFADLFHELATDEHPNVKRLN